MLQKPSLGPLWGSFPGEKLHQGCGMYPVGQGRDMGT